MSKAINDGGPAYPGFPCTPGYGCCKRVGEGSEALWENYTTGISKRDYFAAKAMASLINNLVNPSIAQTLVSNGNANGKSPTLQLVSLAYEMADVMISESEKTK